MFNHTSIETPEITRIILISIKIKKIYNLFEANIMSVFPEALSADVKAIFTNETVSVGAGAAERYNSIKHVF